MSDWGKLFLWMLLTMPWIVCLITAFLAFFPDSLTPDVFLPLRQEWGGWFVVLFLVALGFSAVWARKMWKLLKQKEEAKAKAIEDQNREVEAFDSLSDDLRAFLCDLYFTGEMSREVPLDDPGVQTLLSQGYVSYARAGMVTAHPRYGRAVMVTLSKRSLRLFKNNESAMRRVYIDLVGLIS